MLVVIMANNITLPLLTFSFLVMIVSVAAQPASKKFDLDRDLLLLHYDFKTDVDDLHSVAAFATLAANSAFAELNYHAVAGAYGTQSGLYVPPNDLCELAFGDRWSDAHSNFDQALGEVQRQAQNVLDNQGDIWIAEGGQSDFSAALVKALGQENPGLNTKRRIHIVQHSGWNEEVTSAESLAFAKVNADYHKIPDGNATGNGTPGFRSDNVIRVQDYLGQQLLLVWELAIAKANKYNGVEDRYLNESINKGGLDFSDFSEVCWILGLQDLVDGDDFFRRYSGK